MSLGLDRLVADNLDIWTSATLRKSGAGRGGAKRISLYGIERLRALILDLAVRGKLVSQDAGEERAGELLKRIAKAKAEMIREGTIRKPRELDDSAELNQPFSIPESWLWIRLDQVGAVVGGGTPSSNDAACLTEGGAGIAWLTPADLGGFSEHYIAHGARDLTEFGLKSSSATLMPAGTVLFTSRAPIGYVAIAQNPVTTNQGFKSIVPYMSDSSLFIATALKSFAKGINDSAPGTTFKEVSGKIVAAIPFPLPPLTEQRRIVAKVDELMALCDALERESADAMAAHTHLVDELLATLVNSADAAYLAASWARLETHFDTLFTTDGSVETLKQTILDLAVRGKLVEQDTEDEPASQLMKRIAEAQANGSYKKRITAKLSKAPISEAIPIGWEQVQVGDVFSIRTGFAFKSSTYSALGTLVFRVTNFDRQGAFDLSDSVYFPTNEIDGKLSGFLLEDEDIIMVMVGGTIGKTTKVDSSILPALLNQNMWRIRSYGKQIFSRYEYLLVKILNSKIEGLTQSTHGHFAMGDFTKRTVMIPPLAEQHRIIAKVDALIALCDQLKSRLADAAQTQRHLADTITEHAAA